MRLKFLSIILIFSFAILTLGCSSTSSNIINNSSLINPNPAYSTYVSHAYNYSIEYPVNWTIKEDTSSNKVIFYPPQDNKTINNDTYLFIWLDDHSKSDRPLNIGDYMFGAILDIYRHNRPDLIIQNWGYTNLSGHYAQSFTYTLNNTDIRGMVVYTLKESLPINDVSGSYKGIFYRIEFQAHDREYDKYQKDVQHMIKSFKFINSTTS